MQYERIPVGICPLWTFMDLRVVFNALIMNVTLQLFSGNIFIIIIIEVSLVSFRKDTYKIKHM